MSALPGPRTDAAGYPRSGSAFDPACLDDGARQALERVSGVIWRALLALERHDAEAAERARAEQRQSGAEER